MNLNNEPLVRRLGSEDADITREVNNSNEYEIMKNKYGVEVPIALHLINDKLKRGFIRTDGIVRRDNLTDRVRPVQVESNPAKAMAMMAEQMAEASKIQTEAIKEIAKTRRTKSVNTKVEESEQL